MNRLIQVTTTTYPWGTLRTINANNRFTVVMHPEHYELVSGLADEHKVGFVAECGTRWTATRCDSKIRFTGGGKRVSVALASLK